MTGWQDGLTAAELFGGHVVEPEREAEARARLDRKAAAQEPPTLLAVERYRDPRADDDFEPTPPDHWLSRGHLAGALDEAERFVRRFVVFPSAHEPVAVVLWAAHTYALDAGDVSPYLHVTSPEKRSGKTRLLDVLELLVRKPWRAVLPSEAVVYRKVEADRPTLLLDEVDAIFGPKPSERTESIRALLNSGNRRGTTVPRMVGEGRKMRVQDFPTYCPKALAGIGRLPDTVADRAVPVRLERRARTEPVERFRYRVAAPLAEPLREALAVAVSAAALDDARPDIPDALGDRQADSWEPLLAIADAAGGRWPTRARAAALALSGEREDDLDEASLSLLLLADCRAAFGRREADRLMTAQLVEELLSDDERPWHEVGRQGKPVNANYLARHLLPYGVRPALLRIGESVGRGYRRADLEPAWSRYLPPSAERAERYTVTDAPSEHAATVLNEPPSNGVTVEAPFWEGVGDGAASIDCADYSGHRSHHRKASSGWYCEACMPARASA